MKFCSIVSLLTRPQHRCVARQERDWTRGDFIYKFISLEAVGTVVNGLWRWRLLCLLESREAPALSHGSTPCRLDERRGGAAANVVGAGAVGVLTLSGEMRVLRKVGMLGRRPAGNEREKNEENRDGDRPHISGARGGGPTAGHRVKSSQQKTQLFLAY